MPDFITARKAASQVLASLNHTNIAQIYGLEESSTTRCIVMELVEGQTLQERLKRGPVPVEEALPMAAQMTAVVTRESLADRDLFQERNVKRPSTDCKKGSASGS